MVLAAEILEDRGNREAEGDVGDIWESSLTIRDLETAGFAGSEDAM